MLSLAGRIAELHPRIWQIGWWAAHRFRFLLPHDPSLHALRHFIRAAPRGLFLDVGANDGISALSFRRFDANYEILSLEPNPLLEPKLRRLKQADANFDYMIAGAGDTCGRAVFYVPTYRGVMLHTFVSTQMQQVKDGLRDAFGSRIADQSTVQPVESEIVRIDDLSLDPAIVKVDTEGFEYQALRGMQKTIARSRPFIMLEAVWAQREAVQTFFEARDYAVQTYDPFADEFSSELGSTSRNWFAIPKEKTIPSVEMEEK
jgi:FkbM family methyltransferase